MMAPETSFSWSFFSGGDSSYSIRYADFCARVELVVSEPVDSGYKKNDAHSQRMRIVNSRSEPRNTFSRIKWSYVVTATDPEFLEHIENNPGKTLRELSVTHTGKKWSRHFTLTNTLDAVEEKTAQNLLAQIDGWKQNMPEKFSSKKKNSPIC